ncbi:MAG: hypothetical protein LUD72_05845 [Bacteroidales bacterium]|nr:hypothetical protein [Bacteroidales bacterium]
MTEQKVEWAVYYGGSFLDKTRAVSAQKAINNVRWNRFLSQGRWADWYDFKAVETGRE